MTNSVTRHFYNPDAYPVLQPATPDQNQAMRSHPERPLKDRSQEVPFPAEEASTRIFRAPRHPLQNQFILDMSAKIKAVGYTGSGASPATTGTSKPGVLCMTSGVDLCFAVAIGAEKFTGRRASKVRIFHVMPDNNNAQRDIRKYVQRLQQDGYVARAAIHGGDSTSSSSKTRLRAVEATLVGLEVPLDFRDLGNNGASNGSLGAVIDSDGSVRFISQLGKGPY